MDTNIKTCLLLLLLFLDASSGDEHELDTNNVLSVN